MNDNPLPYFITDADSDECIYATPGELVQSNLYGCGSLGSNPAYNGRSFYPCLFNKNNIKLYTLIATYNLYRT